MWAIITLILAISLLISIGTNNMLRKKTETLEYSLAYLVDDSKKTED